MSQEINISVTDLADEVKAGLAGVPDEAIDGMPADGSYVCRLTGTKLGRRRDETPYLGLFWEIVGGDERYIGTEFPEFFGLGNKSDDKKAEKAWTALKRRAKRMGINDFDNVLQLIESQKDEGATYSVDIKRKDGYVNIYLNSRVG